MKSCSIEFSSPVMLFTRPGYVIDLFEFTFVDFYIFNVADIFITCGAVLCGVSILFFEKRDWKGKEKA